jgi:NTE family protein
MRAMAGPASPRPKVAFVLGGGGNLGAYEVGMLRALVEEGVAPDLVVGTSVGALNGAAIAAQPDLDMVDHLEGIWRGLSTDSVFGGSLLSSAATLMRNRTALHSNATLRSLIRRTLPVERFEDLALPFHCVAACIETATEHWFSEGPLEPAILASTAVPGLFPPVEIDGQHFMDGGLVNSIPLQRACDLGAEEVFVLHVGWIEQPLARPRNLLQVALVSFEIARRHRFSRDLATVPEGIRVHVLPTGERPERRRRDRSPLRYRAVSDLGERIDRAHRSTRAYLSAHL